MQVIFCNNANPNLLDQLPRNKYHTEKTVLFLEYQGKHGFLLPSNCSHRNNPPSAAQTSAYARGKANNSTLSHCSPLCSLSVIRGS